MWRLGKVDYMEILGFSDHRTTADVWYRLLNLGFRIPAAGGTDAMANFASLRGPVGMNRVYARVPDGVLMPGGFHGCDQARPHLCDQWTLLGLTLGSFRGRRRAALGSSSEPGAISGALEVHRCGRSP